MTAKEIDYRQVRNITHLPKIEGVREDTHYATLRTKYSDGEVTTELKRLTDFERPVHITKPRFRNHVQKKEVEEIHKLKKYMTTQSNMRDTVARGLGKQHINLPMRILSDSPYLYGTDTPSSMHIRNHLSDKYGDIVDSFIPSFADTETDMLDRDMGVIIESACVGDTVYVSYNKKAIADHDVLDNLKKLASIHLKDEIDKGLKIVWNPCDEEKEVITSPLRWVDKQNVDILAWWNIDYDVPYILDRCRENDWVPGEIFSDPRVRKQDQYFKYLPGASKRLGSSLPTYMQWPRVYATNTYWWADQSCIFYELRSQESKRESFGVDAIGKEIVGRGKLTDMIDTPEGLTKKQWHSWMQTYHPQLYVIYNIFDTYLMKLIEDKTKDLSLKVPLFMGNLDFNHLKTRTRQVDMNLYQYNRKRGLITGTVGNAKDKGPSGEVLTRDGWIITAPAYLLKDNGRKIMIPFKGMRGNIRIYVLDIDLVSSYPSVIAALNLSKTTTVTELTGMLNAMGFDYMTENINLIAGQVNSSVYCSRAFKMPGHYEITDLWESYASEDK